MTRRGWEQLVWGRVSDPCKPGNGRQALLRWLKFNFVGGIGIGVQLAALAIFLSLLHRLLASHRPRR
jgi:hypothetical protein